MRIKGGTHSRRINLGSPPQYMNYLLHALRLSLWCIEKFSRKRFIGKYGRLYKIRSDT